MKPFCQYCQNDPVTHLQQKELCGVCEMETEVANRKKTNADRIRSMTDEELAEWITKIEYKGRMLGWSINSPTPSMVTDYWLYWLKQEADE